MISIRRERTPVKPVYKAIYIGAPRPSIYNHRLGTHLPEGVWVSAAVQESEHDKFSGNL